MTHASGVSVFRTLTLAALFGLTLARPAAGQVSLTFSGPASASLCSSVTVTTRFENTGGTLAGLIVTQRFPSTSFIYVTNSTTITLPDSSILTGAAADPVLVNSTTLVWNLSSVATSSTVSHLLITEVFYDSTNAAPEEEHEWIELYNPTANPIGLTNWSIVDTLPGSSDTLPTFVMQPGEFVIVAARTNVFFAHFPGYTGQVVEVTDGTLGSGLNNYSDGVILRNAALVAQDAVSYGGSTAAFSPAASLVPVNQSLERNPVNEDSNSRNDWTANTTPEPGSGAFQSGIQNGGVVTIVNRVEISCAAVGGQLIATASYEQPPGGGASAAQRTNFLDVLIGDLVITKTPVVTNAGVGDVVVWTIRVSNEGFGDIQDVKVTDNLGAGVAFTSFSINPTNSFPYGSSVFWDSSVVPAFSNIAPTTSVSIVVTALVTGCSNLFNRADATWGCRGMQVVTNQTCEDTVIEGETAGASLLFIDRRPAIDGFLTAGATPLAPTSVVNVSYCSGGVITLHATNTASGPDAGTAFNVVFTPQLPAGYTLSPTNALGQIPVGNLAPGASTSVTVTIQAGGSCPLAADVQAIYFLALSQDGCANTYQSPFLATQIQLGDFPRATASKIMPEAVPGTATSIPVTVLFAYSNFQNTAITLIDDYPSQTNVFASNITGGGVLNTNNTTVTWTLTNLTGSGVFTGQFNLAIRGSCSGPAFMGNTLIASNYVDCKGCTRSVIGSGLTYFTGVNACPGGGGTTCGATNQATASPAEIEVCDETTITHWFRFHGTLPASWTGVTFTSDLGGGDGFYVSNSLVVTANGSNLTSFVSITQTSPVLTLDLAGLSSSSVPQPSAVTSNFEIAWGIRVTNAGQYVDISTLSIGACGAESEFATWNAGFGTMDVSLRPFLTAEACGITEAQIDIFNIPGLVGITNLLLPQYDVSVVLDLDSDSNGIPFFSYVTNSTRFTNMIAFGGGSITGAEPAVSGNRLTWSLGDLATNGAGSVLFRLHPACFIDSNEEARAHVLYNNRCEDGTPPNRAAYSKTNGPPPLLSSVLAAYIYPEVSFLSTTNISLVIDFANFGNGAAFNVRPELVLPSNIVFSAAGVAPSTVSGTNVVWTMQLTNGVGGLVDRDGDGFFDDLPPGAFFQIGVTVSVNGCASDLIFLKVAQGCDGSFCDVSPFDQATYEPFAGGMVTRAVFPDDGELCGTNVVEYGIRNNGLIDNSIVTVSQILPTGLLYVAGSSRFVFGGVTNSTADPFGTGTPANPLTWDNTIITNFIVLRPEETITIYFDVYAECDAVLGNGQFVAQGQYIDICGNVITERQVSSFLPLGEPLLDISKRGRNPDNGFQTNFGLATLVADVGDEVEFQISVDHDASSEAPVQRIRLRDLLPPSIQYLGASVQPNATNAIGASTELIWSNDTIMALVGGTPYSISNTPNTFSIVITGLVVSCTSSVQNAASVAYGCSDDCLSLTNAATLGLQFDVDIDPVNVMDLRLCSGDRTMHITNFGASAGGVVVTSTAPFGYVFTRASVTGEWASTNLIVALSGSPVGSIAVIDFTSTNTSGAVDLDDDRADGLDLLDLGYLNGVSVVFEMINTGDDLDCRADPLDLDFNDPDVTNTVLRASNSRLSLFNGCNQLRIFTNAISDIAEIPDLDIDVQPNSALATNGQFLAYTFTIRNRAEAGNAENIFVRLKFGTAWTNLAIAGSNIVSSGTTTMLSEIQGSTNVLLNFPGVILDPVDDVIVVTCTVQAVEGVTGDLRVRGEVVGVCTEAGITAPCVFTNSLGEPPLANTMTGSVLGAVNGNYYSFDQDQSYVAGYDLVKTVRLDEEAAPGGTSRNARVGEDLIYRIEARYFGGVFSNVTVIESLPTNLVIGAPYDVGSSASVTGWTWNAGLNTFTLPSPITSDSVFRVEFNVTVSNLLANQGGTIITNIASSEFEVLGVTNTTPTSICTIVVLEPDLAVTKTVNSNLVQSGDTVIFTNVIRHSGASATTAYSVVFSDTLPAGLTFSGVSLGSDGVDNDGDGVADGADSLDEASLVSGETITVTTNNNLFLVALSTNQSVTIVFPAVVTNQLIGSTMINTARVTWTSLDGVGTNFNERTGADGPGLLNDYVTTGTVPVPSAPIAAITKVFVSSSQTNTLDGVNTNRFTIGERVVYQLRVDMPHGIASGVVITDDVPRGLDWVGVNTNAGLAFPGAGYQFTLQSGGPAFPVTTNAGLVIVDPDPTPDDSLTIDGTGSNILFQIPGITNIADGIFTNDYFLLSMEFVVLNDTSNRGLTAFSSSASNVAFVADGFTVRGATSPVYSIVEQDMVLTKGMVSTNVDAGDTVTFTFRVRNGLTALSEAYNAVLTDTFPTNLYVAASYSNSFIQNGWGTSNSLTSTGLVHYFFMTNDTALSVGAFATNVITLQMAQTLSPNRRYTNSAAVRADGHHGDPPGGIPERIASSLNTVVYQVTNMAIAKSLFATSETNIPPDSLTTNAQIGEVVTYQIDVTLPETVITNLQVTDFTPPNGMMYIRNSARVETGSLNGTLGTLNETPTGAGLVTTNGQVMAFTFTNVSTVVGDNVATNNAFQLYLDFIVSTSAVNTGATTSATIHTNRARLTQGGTVVGAVTSALVRTQVIEPQLGLTKNIVQTNADAGDLVTFVFVATNFGRATAYDLLLTDGLNPLYFDPDTVTNALLPTGFVLSVSSTNVFIASDTNAPPGTNTLEVGESLTFTFEVAMAGTLPPNQVVTNRAVLGYDSLDGTNIYAMQRTYSTNAQDTITADGISLQKTLFATSETGPADSTTTNVQVGEVVTYQLQTVLPEGTISNLVFTDVLPTGMSFVVGSLVVDTSSFLGTLAPLTNVTPNAGLLGGNGEDVVITFLGNTVVSNDNNAANDILRLRIDAVVLDTNGVTGLPVQSLLTNSATMNFAGNSAGPVTSQFIVVQVIEPSLAIRKDIDIPGGDAGDTAIVTLVLTNSGLATAYDLVITDTVFAAQFDVASITNVSAPAGFLFDVLTNGADGVVRYRSDGASGQPTNTLEVGEALAFQFSVSLAQGVAPAQVLTNDAWVSTADTIYGTPPTGNDRQEGGQRAGDSLIVSNMTIEKILLNTSETGPSDTTGTNVTIGEVATYELLVTLPEATITNLTVVDAIPAGMSYMSNQVDVAGFGGALPGAPAVTTTGTNGADITLVFNGNTVVSNNNSGADNTFVIRLGLLVLDVAANDGRPAAVDGDGQTVLANSATVGFATNPPVSTSSVVNVHVVEPALGILKSMSGPTGDVVSITWAVTNRGPSTAYDVVIEDLFPTNWWNTASITGVMPPGFVYTVTGAPNSAMVNVASDASSGPATNSIEPGEVLTFQFYASVIGNPPSPITNTVTVIRETTISGTTTNEREEPDVTNSALLALPSVDIQKRLTGPLNRPAFVGETVTFQIVVTNNGAAGLNPVAVTDAFDQVYLQFASAVPPVDSSGAGAFAWTNVGPLAVGQSTSLVVNFTAILSTQPGLTTNTAVVLATTTNGLPLSPETSSAPVEVTTVGYTLAKTTTAPTNRAAQVGEVVSFLVTLVNTGEEALVTVPLADVYETNFLAYVGAVPASDDLVNDGLLNWTDIGPLQGGASTTVVLNFTAVNSSTSQFRTNVVVASPSTATNMPPVTPQTSSAPYAVSRSGYLLTKTTTAPTNRAAQIGEAVTFSVTVQNTGDVALLTVPVVDTYETTYLTYGSSVPASDDNANDGVINWADVGPLPAGASTTLVLNFTASGSSLGALRTNTVETSPTVPTNALPVPPQTSSAPYSVVQAGYTLSKVRTSPTNRAAQVGEAVTFSVTIVNTGDVQLVTVPVQDDYETAYLAYVGAVPASEDNTDDGVINWTNIGPLASGASTTVVLNFTAVNSSTSQFRTNVVAASPTVPTNIPPVAPQTSSAPYSVSRSGYLLTKTTTAPTNRAAQIGEAVTFSVTIVNTGDVQLVTVPVTDTYETVYLTYNSAVPASEDNINDGVITWTNVGPLPAGASTTLVLSFTAAGSSTGQFRTNVVATSPTVPTNDPPVAPQTSASPYSVVSAGYTLNKVLTSHSNNAAQIGQTVTFQVTIANTGDVQLVTVPVTDTYETGFLSYDNATPGSDDNVDDGLVTWSNVGPLNAGASTTLVLNFTALNSSTGLLRTNVVSTAPTTPTNTPPVPPQTSSAPYRIGQAGYTITKTTVTPTNRAAQVGGAVTFNVTIVNTGDVQLVTVPVTDQYETAYITYTGASPASDDNVNDGTITWTDVGPLDAGASTTLVLNFTAAGSSTGAFRTNVVLTAPTVPTNIPPLPPQTSSSPYSVVSAGYTLAKVLTSPTNRSAQVGEAVTFSVTIVNTGDVQLVTVPVTDTYEVVSLAYVGAVPASDDNIDDGVIVWSNVGPLPAGASTTLVLNFTAVSSSTGQFRTNVVSTAPTTPTNAPPVPPKTNTAPYSINSSGYLLQKVLTSPTNRAAQVGEAITFRVTIQNTGDVALVTVPVSDAYETNYIAYGSAVPASVDNADDGLITWADIGPLPVGASTSVVLNFTAVNSSTSSLRTNVVSTAPTVPTNTPPVPPQTSSAPYEVSASGYTLTKTRTSPLGRAAQVGEAVAFSVTIANSGDVDLVTVPVTDTYETVYLTYNGAVPASDDNTDDGEITWANVGPLPVGASTTLVLNFTAIQSSTSQPRTNLVFTAPTVPTNEPPVGPLTSSAPYEISRGGFTVAKVLTGPTNRAAFVGEAVTFRVTIRNTGDVALATVPMTDTYETVYLTYNSAVPASDDNVSDGVITWTNVGALPVGASTTIVLNFTAAQSSTSSFRTNVVVASPTVPTNEPPLPPQTSSAPYEISASGYVLAKTLTSPTNRAAFVGEAVTFSVTIVNTGDVQLVTVPLLDRFDTNTLAFNSAVPPENGAFTGTITWVNIGPLNAGATTSVLLNFTAINSTTSTPRTNLVSTAPTVPTNEPPVPPQTSSAPYEVSRSGYTIAKTRTAPVNRAAQIGEAVTFSVTIVNTGDVQLLTVSVQDDYETAFLAYGSAVPASDDNANDGVITWANVGPLPVGASTTLVLNFTAAGSSTSQPRTNVVFASPTVPTNEPPVPPQTSSAPYEVSRAGYQLIKTVTGPTNRAAFIGESVTFNVTILNTGDVQLVTVPVSDAYETNFLAFAGSTPAADDNADDGVLFWSDVGPLPVGASTTLVLQFTAVNSSTSQPRTNVVSTAPTVPTNEPPLPPQTSSAPYEISDADYTLTKTRSSPTGRAAQVGEAVTFQVVVQNVGDVDLLTVPVADTYETAFLAYNSSVPASDDNTDDGAINWANVGPLPVGASTTIVLNFTAVQSSTSSFRTNVVSAAPTVATNEPPVPPKTNSAPYEISRVGYLLTKLVVAPTGRAAQVGEAVTFNVVIQNTGDVTLVTVPVTDLYETVYLDYVGATPPSVDTTDDGVINWTNVGPITAGASTTLVLNFTASSSSTGQPRTNVVYTTATTPTNEPPVGPQTSSVPYAVNRAGYTLQKTLVDPTNRPAIVGEPVSFRITLVNTGDVNFVTVPLTDTYSTAYLTITNAVPAADDFVNDGLLNWADVGPLPAGQSTSVLVYFRAAGTTTNLFQTNVVVATPTVPPTNPPVPPQTSPAPYVVDAPASLGDFVWDDIDGDGIQDGGEPGVAGATVVLFSTNGAALATNVTGGTGIYGFTNLVPGGYVVQFTPPAGYQFTLRDQGGNDAVDSDPQIVTGFTVTTLLTEGEADLTWDAGLYQPASLGDFIWHDINANGIQDGQEPGLGNIVVDLYTSNGVLVATTTTDVNGAYAFTNLPPGDYFIDVDVPAGWQTSPSDQGGNDTLDSDIDSSGATAAVTLTSGENDPSLDGGLYQPASLGNFVWRDLDNDGIQDGGEPGLAGFNVILFATNGTALATNVTGAGGLYSFTNLVPGDYYLQFVNQPGNVFSTQDAGGDDTLDSDAETNSGFTVSTTLVSGENDDTWDAGFVIYIAPTGQIGNLVFSDINSNGVFDVGSDVGIPGVTVQLITGVTVAASAVTDTNGLYLFTGLAPGSYQVDVVEATLPPGFFAGPLGTSGVDSNSQAQPYGVVLPTNNVNLTADFGYIQAGPVMIGDTVYFDWNSNGVQNVNDTPVPGIRLDLYLDVNTNGVLDVGDVLIGQDTTDTNGNYLFTGLAATNFIVVLNDPSNRLAGTVQTQGTIPQAVDVTDGLDDLTVDFGFYPTARVGTLGDIVWIDVDMDGIPDEDLAIRGINHAQVRLYKVDNGVTNLYAVQNTTNGPGGVRGYYQFTQLPYGDYYVEITLNTVPSNLNVPTTPLNYTRNIGPPASHQDADFGFILANPTAIELKYFDATGAGGIVALTWGTAWEQNTLGFNLYRAESLEGERTLLNGEPVPGQGAETGFDYQYNDATVTDGTTYYYWLEEVETDGDATLYGPVSVRAGGAEQGEVGSFQVQAEGVYRITYETLLAAGIPASQIDPAQVHVKVDGEEVAALVMAYGAMKPGDYLMFYVPAGLGERAVSLVVNDEPSLRMEWVYAEPMEGAGDTYTATAEDGVARFETGPTVIRYLLTGFDSPPVWIFDVTDPAQPKFLFGAADIYASGGLGTYFSYFTQDPAQCMALDDSAVVGVAEIRSP